MCRSHDGDMTEGVKKQMAGQALGVGGAASSATHLAATSLAKRGRTRAHNGHHVAQVGQIWPDQGRRRDRHATLFGYKLMQISPLVPVGRRPPGHMFRTCVTDSLPIPVPFFRARIQHLRDFAMSREVPAPH